MPSSQGVSIEFLEDFNDRLFKGYEAVGVQLLKCTKDSPSYSRKYTLRMHAGDTVQFKYEIDADTWYGYLPGVGEGSFDPKIVRPKVREEWTIQDVAEYVVKPFTKRKENAGTTFVDSLRTAQRGQPFKGVFVKTPAKTTPFRSFVHSMAAYIDRTSAEEDRFLWLDIFCATPHEMLRTSSHAKLVEQIAQQFTEKLLFFANPWTVRASANTTRGEGVVIEHVTVNGADWKLCLGKDTVEGVAAVYAHLELFKELILQRDCLLSTKAGMFPLTGEPLGGMLMQKGMKTGYKKGLPLWDTKTMMPDGPVRVLSPLVLGTGNGKAAKMGKFAGQPSGVFLGQQSLSVGLDFGLLGTGSLTDLLEDCRPQQAQEGFVRAIMQNNETL